jgi:hypothetical protein
VNSGIDLSEGLLKPDDGTVIDILVFYSHGAADFVDLHQNSTTHTSAHPAPDGLLVRIQGWIDATNDSFQLQGVLTRYNLLRGTAVELEELAQNGSLLTQLSTWKNRDAVNSAVEAYAADMVVFVSGTRNPESPQAEGGHGFAAINKPADNEGDPDVREPGFAIVTAAGSATLFGHETGHALGLFHDWYYLLVTLGEDPNVLNLAFDGHGYAIPTLPNKGIRSVMSREGSMPSKDGTTRYGYCGHLGLECDWPLQWSNPSVIIEGRPFGVAPGDPFWPPSSEVRAINEDLRVKVSRVRNSVCRFHSSC